MLLLCIVLRNILYHTLSVSTLRKLVKQTFRDYERVES